MEYRETFQQIGEYALQGLEYVERTLNFVRENPGFCISTGAVLVLGTVGLRMYADHKKLTPKRDSEGNICDERVPRVIRGEANQRRGERLVKTFHEPWKAETTLPRIEKITRR